MVGNEARAYSPCRSLASSLSERQSSSSCSSTSYVAPNDLEFQTYCGKALSACITGSCSSITEDSLESCMAKCSTSQPECYGVSYDPSESNCYILNSRTDNANTTLAITSGVDSALVNSTQLQSPTDTHCPYAPYSDVTTTSGLQFDVLYNIDFQGFGDYCASNYSVC